MSIIDIMRSRRSVRSYKSALLTDEQIEAILEAGMMAPSAHNLQSWSFIVVTNRDVINRLSASVQGYLNDRVEADDAVSHFGSEERVDRVKKRLELKEDTVFYGAPCVVLFVVEKGKEYAPMDCGMASQNMALYAREQGIGSCVIGYARYVAREELIKVGMKDSQELMFGMVFGHSDDMDGQGLDRDFDKIQRWVK
ncbi:MAG: nitroreductase family protein [Candidatus Gracilibacteria bacterium]|jgi:nitroreductase